MKVRPVFYRKLHQRLFAAERVEELLRLAVEEVSDSGSCPQRADLRSRTATPGPTARGQEQPEGGMRDTRHGLDPSNNFPDEPRILSALASRPCPRGALKVRR